MRAVVDPNVLVSAWVSPHGFPRRILEAADARRFEMVVSGELLAELADVLSRPRLLKRGTAESARAHVRRAARLGVRVEQGEDARERVVPGDPKDDYLVALARAGRADCIVSGDPHLLALQAMDALGLAGEGPEVPPVLSPRLFWERLEAGEPPRGGGEDTTT